MTLESQVTYSKAVLAMDETLSDVAHGRSILIGYLLVRACLGERKGEDHPNQAEVCDPKMLRDEILNGYQDGRYGVWPRELFDVLREISDSQVRALVKAAADATRPNARLYELADFVSLLAEDEREFPYLTEDVCTLLLGLLTPHIGGRLLCPSAASLPLAVLAAINGWESVVSGLLDWQALVTETLSNGSIGVSLAPHSDVSGLKGVAEFHAISGLLPTGPARQGYSANDGGEGDVESEIRILDGIRGRLAPGGRAVLLSRDGFVTRASKRFFHAKRALVEDSLSGVICLPAVFSRSMTKGMVLVFDKRESGPQPHIRMMNADNKDFVKRVTGSSRRRVLTNAGQLLAAFSASNPAPELCQNISIDEIAKQHYSLDPQRYVMSAEKLATHSALASMETVALSDVADIVRPQMLRASGAEDGEGQLQTMSVMEVGLGEIGPSGRVRKHETKAIEFNANRMASGRLNEQRLQPRDVLLSYKGKIGLVGIVQEELGNTPWTASQSLVVIRPKRQDSLGITSEFLFLYLKSAIAQNWLAAHSTSQAVPIISISDLRQMPVPAVSASAAKVATAAYVEYMHCHDEIERLWAVSEELVSKAFDGKPPSETPE